MDPTHWERIIDAGTTDSFEIGALQELYEPIPIYDDWDAVPAAHPELVAWLAGTNAWTDHHRCTLEDYAADGDLAEVTPGLGPVPGEALADWVRRAVTTTAAWYTDLDYTYTYAATDTTLQAFTYSDVEHLAVGVIRTRDGTEHLVTFLPV